MKNIIQKIKENQFVVIIVVLVVVLIIVASGRKTVVERLERPSGRTGNITAEQRLMMEIERLRKELDETKKKLHELQNRAVEEPAEKKEEEPEKKEKPSVRLDELLESLKSTKKAEQKIPVVKSPKGYSQAPAVKPEVQKPNQEPRLRRIVIVPEKTAEGPEAKLQKPKEEESQDLILPAGSLIDATLTMGVIAPAGEEAMPAVGVIKGAALGPNGSYVPIRGCTFVGKARGNIGYRIAEIQIIRIACVWPDGSVHESEINAYAGDTNGMFGVPGRVERFSKEFFTTSGVVSFLKGLAGGIARAKETYTESYSEELSSITSSIIGSPYVYGMYKGIEEMMDKAVDFYAKQNAGLIPAVIVEPGKDISIAVLNGITIKGGKKNVVSVRESYFDVLNTATLY